DADEFRGAGDAVPQEDLIVVVELRRQTLRAALEGDEAPVPTDGGTVKTIPFSRFAAAGNAQQLNAQNVRLRSDHRRDQHQDREQEPPRFAGTWRGAAAGCAAPTAVMAARDTSGPERIRMRYRGSITGVLLPFAA